MTQATDEVQLGPIDYLVIEYPDGKPPGDALPHLLDLVDRGVIRVLDFALLAKGQQGEVRVLGVDDLQEYSTLPFEVLAGAASGLLSEEDIAETGAILTPGAIGAVLVYENTWAAPFATALRTAGAQLVANGRIPINAILAALEVDPKEKD